MLSKHPGTASDFRHPPTASTHADIELIRHAVCPEPDLVRLYDQDGWHGTLHVSLSASSEIETLAADAERILHLITGAAITRSCHARGPGIVIGTFEHWADDNFGFDGSVPSYVLEQGHEYIVVSVGGRVLLLGKTSQSAAHALYRFTECLGTRHLGPTPTWEVIERRDRIAVRLSIGETSCLKFMSVPGRAGVADRATQRLLDDWARRNRLPREGHSFSQAYGKIINHEDFKEEFEAHPEWVATHNQLCVLEEGLQGVALAWVRKELEAHPERVVQTLAAADNPKGWEAGCSPLEQEMTPSDRQLRLATYVQEQIGDTGVRISILAYGATSPPPHEAVDPRIVVAVPDGFFGGPFDWQEVVKGYQDQGARDFVPYVYLSIWGWKLSIPGWGRVFDLSLLRRDAERALTGPGSIPALINEGENNWAGGFGLGYWVLAKLCTDRTTTTDERVLRQTFLRSAFGPQADSMSEFYSVMEHTAPLSQDRIHRMYRCLSDALGQRPTAAVKARIHDQAIYTRYLELLLTWQRSKMEDLDAFDAMVVWMWRSRDRHLVPVEHSYQGVWNEQFKALEECYPGYEFKWRTEKPSEGRWAGKDAPFTDDELNGLIAEGIANNRPIPFEPKRFSEELRYVPFEPDGRARGTFQYSAESHSFYLYLRKGQKTWRVTHRGGGIKVKQGGGRLLVFESGCDDAVARIDVVEGVESTCEVDLKDDTLYRVDVKVHSGVFWSCPGFSTTTLTNLGPKIYAGFFSGFFLVPAHTTQLGGYAAAGVTFEDPGRTQKFTTTTIDHFMFPIERRELDQIWSFKGAKGVLAFLTVPPGIAQAPEELLVPSDLQIRL